MRESQIEKHFVKRVKQLGGEAEKVSSPNHRNVPDRLVTFPKSVIAFVEFKATGKKATPGQLRDHTRRRTMGFIVYVINTISMANTIATRLYNASR